MLQRLFSAAARARFTRPGSRFAPIRVPATRREVDYDTYENRFVRFVVTSFRQRALSIAQAARRAGRPSLAREADDIALRFASLLRLAPFSEVGDLTAFTSTSQVLMREDAYNRLLRLYREFVLTADIVWDRFRTLQENRDVAGLYEMWVFVETVRAVGAVLGVGADPEDSATALIRTLPDGLHINLAEGRRSSVTFRLPDGHVRVTYNESYRRASMDPRDTGSAASYSLTLRPDVSIEVRRGAHRRRVFLDAKYRVDGFGPSLLAMSLSRTTSPAHKAPSSRPISTRCTRIGTRSAVRSPRSPCIREPSGDCSHRGRLTSARGVGSVPCRFGQAQRTTRPTSMTMSLRWSERRGPPWTRRRESSSQRVSGRTGATDRCPR